MVAPPLVTADALVDLVPNDFHMVPAVLRRFDRPLLAVAASPPDADGRVSLGLAGDYAAALLDEMPLLVEVNPSMPRTAGRNTVALDDAAAWFERDTPLVATLTPERWSRRTRTWWTRSPPSTAWPSSPARRCTIERRA